MRGAVIKDFEKWWRGADVVLVAQNANGRKLLTKKSILVENSSYFNAMFFSGFKEANQNSVSVPCEYDAMLKILQFIHKTVVGDWTPKKGFPLVDLYHAADMFDFPSIRTKCEHLLKNDADRLLNALCAHERGYRDLLFPFLEKMTSKEVYEFLFLISCSPSKTDSPLFSKRDIVMLYKKLTERELQIKEPKFPVESRSLESLYNESRSPSVVLTKKWPGSDVCIQTKNWKGKWLYSSKTVLASSSEYFQKLFSNRENAEGTNEEDPCEPPLHVDVGFITMKMILEIIHTCGPNILEEEGIVVVDFMIFGIHPVLLYEMYSAASEEKLDIPFIREVCCHQLKIRSVPCLEVAIRLNLPSVKTYLLQNDNEFLVFNWLCADTTKQLVFTGEGEETALFIGNDEPVLQFKELFVFFDRVYREIHGCPGLDESTMKDELKEFLEPINRYDEGVEDECVRLLKDLELTNTKKYCF